MLRASFSVSVCLNATIYANAILVVPAPEFVIELEHLLVSITVGFKVRVCTIYYTTIQLYYIH